MSLVGDMMKAMKEIASLNDMQSWAVSAARGTSGLIVTPENRENPPRPDKPLELYDWEACPFCRKVRDTMTVLDLAYISRPNPGEKTKKVPFLVDPNTDTEMGESEDIITYLCTTYGPGRSGLGSLLAPANTAGSMVASGLRGRGRRIRKGLEDRQQPPELLVLYNIEASPYCRKVREVLTELNLDTLVKNVGKQSARRPELVERGGKMMIPYLIDPNHDVEMYQSDDIVDYLEKTYG